jgi:hypothetical protein
MYALQKVFRQALSVRLACAHAEPYLVYVSVQSSYRLLQDLGVPPRSLRGVEDGRASALSMRWLTVVPSLQSRFQPSETRPQAKSWGSLGERK